MNIILIGFMGTGKTAVGKALAERLSWGFVDLDDVIEQQEGRAIVAIFADNGEPYFRACEKRAVADTRAWNDKVIAPGGGAVLDPENMACLKEAGCVICLTARPEVILERTRHASHRPLLNVDDSLTKINALLKERDSCYRQADLMIDTSSLTIQEVVDRIIQLVEPLQEKEEDNNDPA